MQAYLDGKEIQVNCGNQWEDLGLKPLWCWDRCDYRIKPEPQEPKYRPYKSAEEVLEDMKIHGPMVKKENKYFAITGMDCEFVWPNIMSGKTYENMRDYFIWQDGTPFGRKEE